MIFLILRFQIKIVCNINNVAIFDQNIFFCFLLPSVSDIYLLELSLYFKESFCCIMYFLGQGVTWTFTRNVKTRWW